MKRAATFAFGLALGFAAAPPACAEEELTTGRLLQECNETEGSADWTYCFGIILGVSGVLLVNGNLVDANKNRVPDNGVSMCITEHVSSGAMVQAFRNWAERNPKDWGKKAVLGVMNALHETWPCK
jgi:hypothetical protein